jgi:hypothetical protein
MLNRNSKAIARAEMVTDAKSSVLEPFFQSRQISYQMLREQDVVQQKKWHYYWKKWGCLICGQKDRGYGSIGMCQACFAQVNNRMQEVLIHAYANRRTFDRPRDLVEVAQEALGPSIHAMLRAKNTPTRTALPGNTTSRGKRNRRLK